MDAPPRARWMEDGEAREALWRSERGAPPPARIEVVDDRITADDAYGLAAQGVGLLWRGDFQNARQILAAIASRADRPPRKGAKARPASPAASLQDAFHQERQARAQRARTLHMLLVPLDASYAMRLRRAQDVHDACREAYGAGHEDSLVSLREVLGLVGAHEWRRNGIPLAATGGHIHPHYGVFAPVRNEYVDLVARAPLPPALQEVPLAYDIGTGTGVLAAVLARRGVPRVVATDLDPRALACARENVMRLKLASRIEVIRADLFPPEQVPAARAALVVCNPPWVPARPSSPLEHGIYDPDSRMLRGFLAGLAAHLAPGGEGWLLLSDLAEHLGLRSREVLLQWIADAGLTVVARLEARPRHPKAADASDALHRARTAEVTSLWRLAARA